MEIILTIAGIVIILLIFIQYVLLNYIYHHRNDLRRYEDLFITQGKQIKYLRRKLEELEYSNDDKIE